MRNSGTEDEVAAMNAIFEKGGVLAVPAVDYHTVCEMLSVMIRLSLVSVWYGDMYAGILRIKDTRHKALKGK